MKTNVEKLKAAKMLAEVRQRMGAESPEDDSYDEDINKLTHSQCVAKYAGWYLGDDTWWTDLKELFDTLEKSSLEVEEEKNTPIHIKVIRRGYEKYTLTTVDKEVITLSGATAAEIYEQVLDKKRAITYINGADIVFQDPEDTKGYNEWWNNLSKTEQLNLYYKNATVD